MKLLLTLALFSGVAIAAPQKSNRILPVTKEQEQVKKDKMKAQQAKTDKKAEEDCDDKAKKPIVIEPESLSLGSGTAGCKLPE